MRRGGPSLYRSTARGLRARFSVPLVAAMFISVSLLALSRLQHATVAELRWHVAEVLAPVLAAASGGVEELRSLGRTASGIFELAREVERLKDENQRLKSWEWRAMESERKLTELQNLSSTVKEQPVSFVTGRVIANSSGPFSRSALINAGREQNVKNGYPVLSSAGLAGRVAETGRSTAHVLLLTDLNSRIPVYVGANAVRAVMVGDNGPAPRLAYVPSEAVIQPGDEVSTSGVGGIFPRGLRIGVVTSDGRGFAVKPHAALDSLEYLSVLYYETAAIGLTDQTEGKVRMEARRENLPELPAAVHHGD